MEQEIVRDIFMNTIRYFKEQALEQNLDKIFEQLEVLENEYNEKNNDVFWSLLQDLIKNISVKNITEKEIEGLILTKDNFIFR
jgi:hypothetical protein